MYYYIYLRHYFIRLQIQAIQFCSTIISVASNAINKARSISKLFAAQMQKRHIYGPYRLQLMEATSA